MKPALYVAAGGALGALCRVGMFVWMSRHVAERLWLGTFIVNMLGCFLIGILVALLTIKFHGDHPFIKFALIGGFTGAFTTFSAFSYENLRLLQEGAWGTMAFYAAASVFIGLLLVRGGYLLMQNILGG